MRATASSRRATKRRAAIATATPPSSTLTSAASTRNRSALPTAARTSGRPSRKSSTSSCGRKSGTRSERNASSCGGRAGVETRELGDAAGCEQTRRQHVVVVQQHGRRDLHEAPAFVGPKLQRPHDSEPQLAHFELVADRGSEARHEARLGPDLTARRDTRGVLRYAGQPVGDLHDAAQGVARRHAAHVGQRGHVAGRHDAAKAHDVGRGKPVPRRRRAHFVRQRIDRLDAQVRGQCLAGLLGDGRAHAVGEERHGAHRGDRDHERCQQHQHLARSPVPGQ